MDAVCDQRKEGLKAAAAVRLFLPIVYPEIDPTAAAAKEKQGLPRARWSGLPHPANMIPLYWLSTNFVKKLESTIQSPLERFWRKNQLE